MSYCVHCGVELDPSLKKCPLCSTPVIDPNKIACFEASSPYPSKKGQVEPAKRKDAAVLISVLLIAVALACGLLNFLVFPGIAWSPLVAGFCLLIWVICLPFLICRKLSPYLSVLLDFAAVSFFLFLVSLLTGSSEWLLYLGLPVTALFALLSEFYMMLFLKVSHSYFSTALYLFSFIALSCIGIELLCRNFLEHTLRITWSAIVLTVCAVIMTAIITVLVRPRLREEARRRLHL